LLGFILGPLEEKVTVTIATTITLTPPIGDVLPNVVFTFGVPGNVIGIPHFFVDANFPGGYLQDLHLDLGGH
jgi:hypothetical protein